MLVFLPLVGGCTTGFGIVDRVRVLGAIEFYGDSAVVRVPTEAEAGHPFVVTVQTYGSGCVEKGATELGVADGGVVIRPYDYHRQRVHCPDVLGIFDHTATVRFDAPGTFEVVIEGRSLPSEEVVRVTRAVQVR